MLSLVPDGRTALYDAIIAGLDRIERGLRARKVLIVISDGGDNASRATLEHALAKARGSDAEIYTIGLFDSDDRDKNPAVLAAFAEATGGARYLPRSAGPLLQDCERIAKNIRSGYTLAYEPPAHDGSYRRVEVTVESQDQRRIVVRTRPGYFAGDRRPSHP